MEGLVFKQTVPHVHDCSAVAAVEAGTWDTPWWWPGIYSAATRRGTFLTRGIRRLDSIARRGRYEYSGRNWLELECNCTDCDARMLVRLDVVYDAVPTGESEEA